MNYIKNYNLFLESYEEIMKNMIKDIDVKKIETSEQEIGKLKHLKILRLGKNRLTSLPENLSEADSLQVLDISANISLELRPAIAVISKIPLLNRLEMSDMNLKHAPKAMSELHAIRTLNLRGNALNNQAKEDVKKLLPTVDIDF
jgi:Leucine-rich repeat (LRR) protein